MSNALREACASLRPHIGYALVVMRPRLGLATLRESNIGSLTVEHCQSANYSDAGGHPCATKAHFIKELRTQIGVVAGSISDYQSRFATDLQDSDNRSRSKVLTEQDIVGRRTYKLFRSTHTEKSETVSFKNSVQNAFSCRRRDRMEAR